nr:hypothetical protein Iba_chr07cCG10900 [Ipomoea batatas]
MEELQNNWNTYRRQRGSAGRRPKAEERQSAVDSSSGRRRSSAVVGGHSAKAEGRRWAVACGRRQRGGGHENLVFSDLHCCRPTTYALRVYALSPHGLTALTSSDSLTPSAHHANASTFPLRRR